MKIKSVIISLLAVLMLMSACTAKSPSPVIEEFTDDEKLIVNKYVVTQRHMNEKYQIPVNNNGLDATVVASSFKFDGALKTFPKLKEFMTSHDDYLGDTPLRHPVYGPVVFDGSLLANSIVDSLFYVAFIDGNCGSFQVQSCESVELKNRSLNVEIGIYISSGGASYDMTPTLIIVEIKDYEADDIKSAKLTFIPKEDRIDD